MSAKPPETSKRKTIAWRARLVVPVLFLLVAIVGLMVWLFTQTTDKGSRMQAPVSSSHPVFGEIHEANATDVMEVPPVQELNDLPPKIPVFLVVGHHLLEWSVADLRPKMQAGYLYFWDPKSHRDPAIRINASNVWSFAACAKSNLIDVASNDLPAIFCVAGENDKGRNCFGTNWVENSIRVKEGEVILVRHSSQPSKIYAVEITRQNRGHLQARYVEIDR
jgi:hypothetical protein